MVVLSNVNGTTVFTCGCCLSLAQVFWVEFGIYTCVVHRIRRLAIHSGVKVRRCTGLISNLGDVYELGALVIFHRGLRLHGALMMRHHLLTSYTKAE